MQLDPDTFKSVDYNEAFAGSSGAAASPEDEPREVGDQKKGIPPKCLTAFLSV